MKFQIKLTDKDEWWKKEKVPFFYGYSHTFGDGEVYKIFYPIPFNIFVRLWMKLKWPAPQDAQSFQQYKEYVIQRCMEACSDRLTQHMNKHMQEAKDYIKAYEEQKLKTEQHNKLYERQVKAMEKMVDIHGKEHGEGNEWKSND